MVTHKWQNKAREETTSNDRIYAIIYPKWNSKAKIQVEETAKSVGEGRARKVNKNTLLHTIIDVKIQFYIYKDKQYTSINMYSLLVLVTTLSCH